MRIEFRDSRDGKPFKPESVEKLVVSPTLLIVIMKDKNRFLYPWVGIKEVKVEPEIAIEGSNELLSGPAK